MNDTGGTVFQVTEKHNEITKDTAFTYVRSSNQKHKSGSLTSLVADRKQALAASKAEGSKVQKFKIEASEPNLKRSICDCGCTTYNQQASSPSTPALACFNESSEGK